MASGNAILHGIPLDSPAIRRFCRRWKISELSVFGSILSDQFGPESDVDFLVDYAPDAEWDLLDSMRMKAELGRILGRDVDVLDREGVETCENRLLRRQILASRRKVYAS